MQKSRSGLARLHRVAWQLFITLALLASAVSAVVAGPRETAKAIHDRLTGVPPSANDLATMAGLSPVDAALYAIDSGENRRYFATVTLKNFAAPWTNREQSVFVPLNDYTTLVIGMVINDQPFDEILTADRLYVQLGAPPPTASSNAHYEALETRMRAPDFDPATELVEMPHQLGPFAGSTDEGNSSRRASDGAGRGTSNLRPLPGRRHDD